MAVSVPPHSGSGVRSSRILIVDDDPMVLRALRRLLLGARPAWEIDMAESVEAASVLLDAKVYDVVVTDLHMPAATGLELLERLKAERPDVMRVIHSSQLEAGHQIDAGLAHALVAKSGRPDELIPVIDWALDQRKRRLRDSVGY
jgi:DNA-binding NtrC family response regulator